MYNQRRGLTGIKTPVSGRGDSNDARQREKRFSTGNMGDNRNRNSTGFAYGIPDLNLGSYQENFLQNNGRQQETQLQGSPQRHHQQQVQPQLQQPQLVYPYSSYQYQMQYSSYPYMTYPAQISEMQPQLQNQGTIGPVSDYNNTIYSLTSQQTVPQNANYVVTSQVQTTGAEPASYPKERNINLGTRSPVKQQHYGHGSHRSPTKNRSDTNFSGEPRKFHYKELDSVDDMYKERKNKITREKLDSEFFKFYFKDREVIDINAVKNSSNNKSKFIVNRLPKRGSSSNQGSILVYKLSKPFMSFTPEEGGQAEVLSLLSQLTLNAPHQELMLGGNPSYRVDSLKEFTEKLFNRYMQKTRNSTGPGLASTGDVVGATGIVNPNISKLPHMRTIINSSAPSYNDSFDLSFDGKAINRSDIFQIVDSFSVAFSDDDNTNNSSIIESTFNVGIINDGDAGVGLGNDGNNHGTVKRILPDEISKWQ